MSFYSQPGSAFGSYTPSAVSANCPSCGLAGRRVGSTAYSFRCDNAHHFDRGAASTMPQAPGKIGVQAEPGAANFLDVITGKVLRP